jgi:hypothetical protein
VMEIPENRVPLETLIAGLVKRDALTALKAKRSEPPARYGLPRLMPVGMRLTSPT